MRRGLIAGTLALGGLLAIGAIVYLPARAEAAPPPQEIPPGIIGDCARQCVEQFNMCVYEVLDQKVCAEALPGCLAACPDIVER